MTSDLTNTGILLTFGNDDTDQCFKVLCAALLLAESLDDLNEARHLAARPELKFRFGVHVTTRPRAASTETNSDAIADTVVLSAVAPEGSIAASREAFERLPRPGTLHRRRTVQSDPAYAFDRRARQLRDRLGGGRRIRRRARPSGRTATGSGRLDLDAVDLLKSARQHRGRAARVRRCSVPDP